MHRCVGDRGKFGLQASARFGSALKFRRVELVQDQLAATGYELVPPVVPPNAPSTTTATITVAPFATRWKLQLSVHEVACVNPAAALCRSIDWRLADRARKASAVPPLLLLRQQLALSCDVQFKSQRNHGEAVLT